MHADFDLVMPETLDEALHLLAEGNGAAESTDGALPLAGGTNMIVDLRARRVTPAKLVGLGKLDGLRGIRIEDGRVRMGGRTTMTNILLNRDLAKYAPSLVEQARVFAGQMVRNAATVAGNICCGSPAADAVPPLLALDAEITLAGKNGSRVAPLSEFFLDYKKSTRAPDELLTEVAWDLPPENSTNCFYKLARRRGDAIAVVGIAVAMTVEGGRCSTARIALGAVAPIVKRAIGAEEMLAGEALTPALIDEAARQAVEESDPIDDVRASADYRRHGVHVLTRRLLTQAWERLS
jgi:carbon-monoxide dehydrogenase medium subunit